MAWPTVIIKILNLMFGPIAGVEFHFLYLVYGTVSEGDTRHLMMIDNTSDLDGKQFAHIDAAHLATLKAAQLNGKQNWTAGIMVLKPEDEWQEAVFKANETSSFETTVICWPMTTKAEVEEAIALRAELKNKLSRETFVIATTPAVNADPANGQTWAEWLAATVNIPKDVASEYITVVPQVHQNNSTIGIYAGRLSNQEVSIADTPARVKTGSVLGDTELAKDKTGKPMDLATLRTLESNRLAVPMWYPDYPGQYWTTGRTLDVPGGDYQDIRHIRVAMKAARKVRVRAIARIGDRTLNSTPESIFAAKKYLSKDLREMARTGTPGEIYPPEEEDIQIKWVNSTDVEIGMQVQPYECPVKITVSISIKQGEY